MIAAFAGLLLTEAPARAENTLPPASMQEQLIKTTLLTFNDANLTKNYNVLHARMAKPFREQFTAARMQQVFKGFSDKGINLASFVVLAPVVDEAKVDGDGVLHLSGYFKTEPYQTYFNLDFVPSENEWKPTRLNVNTKKPGE